jgi:rod shape determining protein RodA
MYQKNSSITKGKDWVMIWLYALIILIGLICIISVEYKSTDNFTQTLLGFKKNYSKQLYYFGACCVLATFILLTDSKFLPPPQIFLTCLVSCSYLPLLW